MPSENVGVSPVQAHGSPDRRTRKRDARRDHLLDLAADLVDTVGVDGVTMTALAQVADYAPASLYTYFASRSALLAALQERALLVLGQVATDHLSAWNEGLATLDPAPTEPVAALARLWAFAELFLAAPDRYPREFRLQQQLLVSTGAETSADAAAVVPTAMIVLDVPRRLLDDATGCGALSPHDPTVDPIEDTIEGSILRTFVWIVSMNGALLADGLTTGLPTTGTSLGVVLTDGLLRGWGADDAELLAARPLAQQLRSYVSPSTGGAE